MFLGWECAGCQNGHSVKEYFKVPEACLNCGEKLFRRIEVASPNDGLYPERKPGVAGVPMYQKNEDATDSDESVNINPSLGDWLNGGSGNIFISNHAQLVERLIKVLNK